MGSSKWHLSLRLQRFREIRETCSDETVTKEYSGRIYSCYDSGKVIITHLVINTLHSRLYVES